jgi:tetratricopeptide (TPR) repeat protein
MSANTANARSWLSAHGQLWYDDRWYRLAWIVWPQALGLLLVTLWLYPPSSQGFIPWARPVTETPQNPPAVPVKQPDVPVKQPPAPPLAQPPLDAMAPCKLDKYADLIAGCTTLLASGNLRGSNIPDAYWRRGWAYYSTEQYQPAMSDYDRAIAIAPGNADYYNSRGILWIVLGNNERAMQDLDQSLLLKPDFANAHMNRGVALYRLKRPNEALVAYSRSIDLDATQWLTFENRATIYEDRANWRAVYDDAVKLIELAPNYQMGYALRGHAYFESGQYQAAVVDFSKAMSLAPNLIYNYRMRGRSYSFLNQFDDAMKDFESALRIDAKDSNTISYINDMKLRQRR